ncbi:MAG: tryptophan--tRNA ligase [Candidatus Saccharimonadales bacterium]
MQRNRVLTGLRANDVLTLGNYLGAIQPMAELLHKHKDTHDIFMFVPDLHSFTTPINHDDLYANTIRNIKFFVAAGAIDLKSKQTLVYRQSHVPAHSEMAWILSCFTYFGEMRRMTQFKDKSGIEDDEIKAVKRVLERYNLISRVKKLGSFFDHPVADIRNLFIFDRKDVAKEIAGELHKIQPTNVSVGLFTYPVLMAADILLYGAKYVPVGEDQRQHVEITRDIALRVNEKFKDVVSEGVFPVVPVNWKQQLKFSGLDRGLRIRSLRNPAKKMSKSDADPAGYILLLDKPEKAAKKIMAATTDSEGVIRFDWAKQPGVTNLLQILAMLQKRDIHAVITEWQGKTRYGELKQAAAKAVGDFLTDYQNKLDKVDEVKLVTKLEADEAKARELSAPQLLKTQQAVGLRPRP